jgi:deoxyribonuclease-4
MSLYLGAHTVDNGGIDMAARRAARAGMKALQIFTAIPKYYGDKVSIRAERVERFRTALAETDIDPRHVVAHAAYVLNTATPEPDKWTRARDGLTKELERSTRLGLGVVCFHPGAAIDGDTTAAAERVASAIAYALDQVPGNTRVLVENTAGAGRTFARTAAEVGAILAHVPERVRSRTGYGLDTCHLWASGYDIEGAFASNRDRHVLLGEGTIGAEPFKWLLEDRRSHDIPLILETPQQNMEIGDDDASADPFDLRMMELLGG